MTDTQLSPDQIVELLHDVRDNWQRAADCALRGLPSECGDYQAKADIAMNKVLYDTLARR